MTEERVCKKSKYKDSEEGQRESPDEGELIETRRLPPRPSKDSAVTNVKYGDSNDESYELIFPRRNSAHLG